MSFKVSTISYLCCRRGGGSRGSWKCFNFLFYIDSIAACHHSIDGNLSHCSRLDSLVMLWTMLLPRTRSVSNWSCVCTWACGSWWRELLPMIELIFKLFGHFRRATHTLSVSPAVPGCGSIWIEMELLTARPERPIQARWRQNGWASDWVNGSRKCDFISTRGDITQTHTCAMC